MKHEGEVLFDWDEEREKKNINIEHPYNKNLYPVYEKDMKQEGRERKEKEGILPEKNRGIICCMKVFDPLRCSFDMH